MQSLSELSKEESSEQEEWEVEKILKERSKRVKDKKTDRYVVIKEYLVKWLGFAKPTWEPEENLDNCQEILKDFLLSQIMKKLKAENKKNKILENKRKSSFNSISDDEEQDMETSTISNSVNVNKNINNNKKKKVDKCDNNETDVDFDIEIGKDYEVKTKKGKNKAKDEIIVVNEDIKGNNDQLELKIMSIKSMKIPKDKNQGIILNIKYEKEGKTFIEKFNTKIEEIPSDYLVKYYEKFICEKFQGSEYNEEMSFL